jgi:hypothetical protein
MCNYLFLIIFSFWLEACLPAGRTVNVRLKKMKMEKKKVMKSSRRE